MEQLKIAFEGKEKQIQHMEEELQKKFSESEEYMQMEGKLIDKENELTGLKQQLNLMEHQIESLEKEKQAMKDAINNTGIDTYKQKVEEQAQEIELLNNELAEVTKE